LRSVYRKSSSCAFCVDTLGEGGWNRARGCGQTEGGAMSCGACTEKPHPARSAWTRSHSWEEGGCIRQRCSNRAGCRWHCGIRLVVRIGRFAHEITTGGCLQAKMPRQNAPFCRAFTRKPHSAHSVCTRSGKRAGIGLFLRSVYRKSASCAFCVDTLGEGGWNRARGCGQTEGGSYVLRSVYRKSSFCAFCVDTLALLGRGRLYQAEMQQPGRLPLALWHPTGGSDRALRARDNHRRMPTSENAQTECSVLQSVYKKTASCAFRVDQLRGRVLDGCHERAW
jgi:hypothetical protein